MGCCYLPELGAVLSEGSLPSYTAWSLAQLGCTTPEQATKALVLRRVALTTEESPVLHTSKD